jgi:phosphinothricin acetyltransferase
VLLNILGQQGFRSAFAEIVLPNQSSVRLHEAAGFKPIGVHKDIGFKLGRWHDIGYWRMGLASTDALPSEPVPFASFRRTPAFAVALGQSALSH